MKAPPACACGGTVFVRAPAMEQTGEPLPRPLAITFGRVMNFRSFFSAEMVETGTPDLQAPIGELEVLFCRTCGKVEWFVKYPGSVPIGESYGTELVEAAPSAPYR